jgi:hypothetical protein
MTSIEWLTPAQRIAQLQNACEGGLNMQIANGKAGLVAGRQGRAAGSRDVSIMNPSEHGM